MYPRDVDDREFGIDPDEEACEDCGAGPLEDCAWWCQCSCCVTGRAKGALTHERKAG